MDAEALLFQFDRAWKQGTPLPFSEILRLLEQARPAPTAWERRRLLEELVKIDLEYRWRSQPGSPVAGPGKRPRLEDYLRDHPELGPVEQLSVELIGAEYWVR